MAVVVHSADIQDRTGVKLVMEALRFKYPRLKKILADVGYTGDLALWGHAIGRMDAGVRIQSNRDKEV